jgi:uncharacterized DUF497 family protein
VKLAQDGSLDEWLGGIAGAAGQLDWDAGNRAKNRKHGVEPSEVESPAHDEPRWLLLGETVTGRRLALIFTRRGDRLRPISCRAMRRNGRRLHDDAKAKLEGGSEEGR